MTLGVTYKRTVRTRRYDTPDGRFVSISRCNIIKNQPNYWQITIIGEGDHERRERHQVRALTIAHQTRRQRCSTFWCTARSVHPRRFRVIVFTYHVYLLSSILETVNCFIARTSANK